MAAFADLAALNNDLQNAQRSFIDTHKYYEEMKAASEPTTVLKSDLRKMEEERHQALNKLEKMKKRGEDISNHEVWLEAARTLRLARKNEAEMATRFKEQQNIIQANEKKELVLTDKLRSLKVFHLHNPRPQNYVLGAKCGHNSERGTAQSRRGT